MDDRLGEFLRRKRQVEHSSFAQQGINAVGVGYRLRKGKLTDELCIQFFVERKLSPDTHRLEMLHVDGYPTDVIELKRPIVRLPASDSMGARLTMAQGQTPLDLLTGGIEIGRLGESGVGTLGGIVFDEATGAPNILSNWHVMAAPGQSSGQGIAQPGNTAGNRVATLANAALGATGVGWIDAAIATLDGNRGFNQNMLGIAPPATRGVAPALLSMHLTKSGRTTAVTHGLINSIDVTIDITYPPIGTVRFERQFIIFPHPSFPVPEISDPGDSGSLWLEAVTHMAVGLHYAGEGISAVQDLAIVSPMPQVVKSMQVRFGPAPDMPTVYRWWHGELADHFYTTDPNGELAPSHGYLFEGAPFALFSQPGPGLTPLYRWFKHTGQDHFYTTDPNGELAPGAGYVYEGITGYICQGAAAGLTELFRWWNPELIDHFYTTDPSGEVAPISGYTFEGLVGWVQPLVGL